MKRIILSALLASTVAVTAFAADPVNLNGNPPPSGEFFGHVGSLAAYGAMTSFTLTSAADGSFVNTLKNAGAAQATEVNVAEGKTPSAGAQGVTAAEVQVSTGPSIFCVTPHSLQREVMRKITVFCGPKLTSVVALAQVVSASKKSA